LFGVGGYGGYINWTGGYVMKIRTGIYYYKRYETAQELVKELKEEYPDARVVYYELGYAVQYRISGPYFPELENENGTV
jgi:hypothetical protein